MRAVVLSCILFCSSQMFGQDEIKKGVPEDLDKEKIIILMHEKVEVGSANENQSTANYVVRRQENHNTVSDEFNQKLNKAFESKYPFDYVLAYPSEMDQFFDQGYKYVLYSNVYSYEHLKDQPNEGELIVFTYVIKDRSKTVVYEVFELDEMKVYDANMILKKLNREAKKKFPAAY